MPVNPPYSIIDTIARLRASQGAAVGNGLANAGGAIGQGVSENAQGQKRAQAAAYHDATVSADNNFDWKHIPPPTPGAPAQPGMGLPGGAGSGGPLGMSMVPQAPGAQGRFGSAPQAPSILGGTPVTASTPATLPAGALTLSDWYLAHGLKPTKGSENIYGTPKQQDKSDAAENLQKTKNAGAQETAETKAQAEADAAHSKYFTKVDPALREMAKQAGIPIKEKDGEEIPSQTAAAIQKLAAAKTSASGKTDSAKISADAKRDVAKINARLKSPDNQIRLQAMKDRDAYITKNPATEKLFGVPDEIGKVPTGAGASGGAGTPPAPAVGAVIKGHKFLGGDPADQANWEAQ